MVKYVTSTRCSDSRPMASGCTFYETKHYVYVLSIYRNNVIRYYCNNPNIARIVLCTFREVHGPQSVVTPIFVTVFRRKYDKSATKHRNLRFSQLKYHFDVTKVHQYKTYYYVSCANKPWPLPPMYPTNINRAPRYTYTWEELA